MASGSAAVRLGATANTSYSAATAQFASGGTTIYGDQKAERFGAGTTIDYDAASDSYTFKRSDGLSITMAPSNINRTGTFDGSGGIFGQTMGTGYEKEEAGRKHTIAIVGPGTYQGIKMSYMTISIWNVLSGSGISTRNELQWQLWGNRTQTMPTTGTATYKLDGGIGANGFEAAGFAGTAYDFLKGESTGNLSVNFGSGSINLLMNLIGYDYVGNKAKDFGNFNGSGSITSGSPNYSGTFTQGGDFYGAFFGPAAEETGFTFFINTSTIDITGVAVGFKQP